MNLCRCENGHFYDKEKYATCPHCAKGAASDDSLTSVFTEDMTTAAATDPVTEPKQQANPVNPEHFGSGFSGTDVTEQFTSGSSMPVAGFMADQPTMPLNAFPPDTPTVPMTDINSIDPVTEPLHTVSQSTADDDDDHTIGFFDDEFFTSPASAVQARHQASQARPVNKVSTPCVGWLIAIGGKHIGTDFRLKVGKNFIGRSPSMDVALTEDMSVSRDRHAIVVYEPKQHLYLVQPGESSSLVYRNNEVVLTPVKLEAYDVITVGEVNLLFMPLCGKRFNWSTLFEEMKQKNQ